MTEREKVLAVLRGERIGSIPILSECPMDVTALRGVWPEPTDDPVRDRIAESVLCGNSSVGVYFGIESKTLSRDANHHEYRYETGAVWRESYQPTFCREALEFPINTPEDAMMFTMPDASAIGRLDEAETRRAVDAFHDAGYFVEGGVIGAWGSIYYYLTSFENILMWMSIEPDAAHAVFDMTRKYSLTSAKRLLDCGVDCIHTGSDLGSGSSLLFSPSMFREYVYPWLKELADLCHEYGRHLQLHSHGHIQDIMDGIVASGVDIINPVGPSDHNDLDMFKKRWGDKIVLHGGISTTIASMGPDEMREHVRSVIEIGRRGGRFFPRTESGIPVMPREKILQYLSILKEECGVGYS
jgi:uroporphyrinogen decarboxylase